MTLQRHATVQSEPSTVPSIVHEVLSSPGQPLDGATRLLMESRFGHDFSRVRVHSDLRAAESALSVSAKAYTVGPDIAFARGQHEPNTTAGRSLLAHELAHVVQQSPGTAFDVRRVPIAPTNSPSEHNAEMVAAAVESVRAVPKIARTGVQLARVPDRGVQELEEEEAAVPETTAQGQPRAATATRPEVEELDYAFFFAGGAYGQAARDFIRTYYPRHRRVEASSFEEMFDRLHADLHLVPLTRDAHLGELIIVTHANAAGGLRIPLTRGDVQRHRFFNLWDLADLQQEFRQRFHRRFSERRREVVRELFDDNTRVIVRGCEFGQAQEALDALRSFFGGQPYVWAPRGFQGYETLPIERSMLHTPEEAYDFLIQQGYLPPELQPLPEEERREYIARVFGLRGAVPAEFFVMDREAYTALRTEIVGGRGTQSGAEGFKTRDESSIPSLGERWALSSPSLLGEDSELDTLSIDEIEARARALNRSYRPEYAWLLQRLSRAWERKGLETLSRGDPNDPLAGLPPESIFGDTNIVAIDAHRFPGPPAPTRDLFMDETLRVPPRTQEDRAQLDVYEEPPAAAEGEVRRPAATRPAGSEPRMPQPGAEAYRRARDFSKSLPPLPPAAQPALDAMSERDLGREYLIALELARLGDPRRLAAVEEDIARRIEDDQHRGFGVAIPPGEGPYMPANAGVDPDIALRILENFSRGEAPFRPELGRVGRVSWFVTEGNPYVGSGRGGPLPIQVEIAVTQGRLVFTEDVLLRLLEEATREIQPRIETEFRAELGLDASARLTARMRRNLSRLLERAAERQVWERVGERVRASSSGVGEVILENSRFSRSGNGRFAVVAERARASVRLRGGAGELVETLRGRGVTPDPVVTAAAQEMSTRLRWTGRVRGAFRWGGRILVVVALANDAYHIYTTHDRTRAVITTAGGWAGALAAGAFFAEVWTPADTAGPVAWAIHGIGTLIAGGIGYYVGSETTTWVYELVLDSEGGSTE